MEKERFVQELIQKHTGIKVSLINSKAIYEDLLTGFSEEIMSEKGLSLKGIGKLMVKESPERMVRNPRTGEEMIKPLNNRVAFKASNGLKQLVNN